MVIIRPDQLRLSPEKRSQDGRLAGPGFADDAEGLAGGDREGNPVDRARLAEIDAEGIDLDHGASSQAGSRLSTGRSPSPPLSWGRQAIRPCV